MKESSTVLQLTRGDVSVSQIVTMMKESVTLMEQKFKRAQFPSCFVILMKISATPLQLPKHVTPTFYVGVSMMKRSAALLQPGVHVRELDSTISSQ
jgi:predicted RNA-binding protein